MKIDWIFFDIGGVLLDDSAAIEAEFVGLVPMLQPHVPDITIDMLKAYLPIASAKPNAFMFEIIRHFVPDTHASDEIISSFRKQFFEADFYTSRSHVRPEAHEVLKNLSSRYKLGLMGNQPQKTIEKLREDGILDYFHHQKASDHYGLIKPDPRFFQAVFDDVGAQAATSAIIDDNIERALVPAKTLGMTTVWYKLVERAVPDTVVDYTITSFHDLLGIF